MLQALSSSFNWPKLGDEPLPGLSAVPRQVARSVRSVGRDCLGGTVFCCRDMCMLQAMSNADDVEETEILADADFAEAG